jgi:hypothetical protein
MIALVRASRREVLWSGAALVIGTVLASEAELAASPPAGAEESDDRFEDDAHEEILGTIVLFAGDFTPVGFRGCHGEGVPVSSNTSLYELIGNEFGGTDTEFDLPNLNGNLPSSGSAMRYVMNVDGNYPRPRTS